MSATKESIAWYKNLDKEWKLFLKSRFNISNEKDSEATWQHIKANIFIVTHNTLKNLRALAIAKKRKTIHIESKQIEDISIVATFSKLSSLFITAPKVKNFNTLKPLKN